MSEDVKEPEVEQTAADPRELTPEEIEEREKLMKAQKEELKKFYKAEMPLLKLQAEYEELITRIETAKMQRFEIMMMKAQMMQGPGEEQTPQTRTGEHVKPSPEVPDAPEPGMRKLKKEE